MKKVLFTAIAAMAMFAMTACNNQPAEATEDTTNAAVAEQCDKPCMDTTAHEGCCAEMAAVEGQACEHKCQKAEGQECQKACEQKCQKAEGQECCKKAEGKECCKKAEGKECEHKCQK